MMLHFTAEQSLKLTVPAQPLSIQAYLRKPQRLVHALADPRQVESLGDDVFRLKMRSLQFLTLKIQPTVDLKFWVEENGQVKLTSTQCCIEGNDYIDQRFSLKLHGILVPQPHDPGQRNRLTGKAHLTVKVEPPPALWLTPRALLEATGNGLLRGVLGTIKQRLLRQLAQDYQQWVAAQVAQGKADSESDAYLSSQASV